jgi:STE24 endopeptidase
MTQPNVPEWHPEFRPVGPPPVGRRPDSSSLLAAVLGLPGFLGSLLVMSLLGTIASPPTPWLIPVLWMLSGALLLAPSVEPAVCRLMFSVRRPTGAERYALELPWQAVCRAAGTNSSRYVLLVEDSDDLNAFAAGSRTVAVTRAALGLAPQQLEAVLAHELGHHLAGHSAVSMLSWWYALPARLAAYLVGLAARIVLFVGRIFAGFGSGLGALASLLLALMLLAMFAFLSFWLILIPLTAPLLAWAHRLGEFHADRIAASLGYAPPLIEVLHTWMAMADHRARPSGARTRLLATHPAHADRIRRLQELGGV